MKIQTGIAALSLALAFPAALSQAQDLSSCGDIELRAEAQCEFIPPSANCMAMCTPVTVEAACAAQLYASCDGMCTGSIEAGCEASCHADCVAECEVDPGEFSCEASCSADCSANCSAACEANGGGANCEASCKATCRGGCEADCQAEPPSASCDARCDAGCEGSCQAQANLDCQIDCQADAFAMCEVMVQGGCEASCMTERGALFCDGQYVDPRDDIESCVAAIQSALDIEVSGYADGDASCENGECTAEASVGSNCSVSQPGRSPKGMLGFGALALGIGALVMRRRKR